MPMDKRRYGPNWNKVSRTIRRVAGQCCEFCGVHNGSPLKSGRSGKVVLTVAHLGVGYPSGKTGCKHDRHDKHDKHDVRRENLKSLCQSCHLSLDLPDHIAHAKETRQRKIRESAMSSGQLALFQQGGNDDQQRTSRGSQWRAKQQPL